MSEQTESTLVTRRTMVMGKMTEWIEDTSKFRIRYCIDQDDLTEYITKCSLKEVIEYLKQKKAEAKKEKGWTPIVVLQGIGKKPFNISI